jgi:hypothetical protein
MRYYFNCNTNKRQSNTIKIAHLWLFVLFFSACATKKQTDKLPDANIYTLVFMDKTQSVHVDKAFVTQKYEQLLVDLVTGNIHQKNDKLEVYFIHENTQKAKALSLTSRTEKVNTEALSPTDREAAQTNYDLMLERERMVFVRQLKAKLSLQNIGTSRQHTDIWASLPVIAQAAETGADVRVYYLSDMIESMTGTGRRDFHQKPPKDNTEAQDWAKADAAKLKYSLSGSTIKMALPFEPTSSTRENNPNITTYWSVLLEELGVTSITEI